MAFQEEYARSLAELGVYGVGIALYTLAVAILYVPMGTRMMFARRFGEKRIATPGRRFMFVFFFPLVSFLFFLVIAASMLFMAEVSDDALSGREAMTISMAVVLAIRICAYFSEHAASDLAKIMPLSMLAVVLVTNGFGDLAESVERLEGFAEEPRLLALFFLVVLVIEFLLRIIYEVLGRPGKGRDPRDPVPGFQKRPL